MLTKETRRLFQGQYQYKAVLVCPAAGWFRGRNVSEALDKIKENGIGAHKNPFNKVKTPEDFDYCMKLAKSILKMSNFNIRVESPFISFYTNNRQDISRNISHPIFEKKNKSIYSKQPRGPLYRSPQE